MKRDEISSLRNRYVVGLEKLEFAASQVSVMKDELIALQPKLVETSAETEKLMVKIAQDTVEVEAKKEVCGICRIFPMGVFTLQLVINTAIYAFENDWILKTRSNLKLRKITAALNNDTKYLLEV